MTDLNPVTADEWAAAINKANLTPGPTFGYRLTTGGWELATHVAIADDIADDKRAELITALQDAISATLHQVLGRQPVIQQDNYADGTSRRTAA
ncbi:hypothetical protein PV703_15645 [Streptomyces sp. ME01-24h]|nr:hypothetical protein [Streptomyces sp. ME01-24h]